MHGDSSRNLEELSAQLGRLEAELEALRRQVAGGAVLVPRRRRSRRVAAGIVLAIGLVASAIPAIVLASHRFTDVPTTNTFHADIDAIADVGVTVGCAVGKYCPGEFVTREQMAAFMNRLGALGPGKTPVVNATKLDGKDSTEFLAANGKAADSNLLDGQDSTAFLAANGKAADSNLLDGLNSTAFLAANGKAADSDTLDGLDSTAFLAASGTADDTDLLDGIDSTGFEQRLASGSQAVDFGSITALTCVAAQIGNNAPEHGTHVLVNHPYDEAAITTAPTMLTVTAVRVADGAGDDIWVKVCNLNLLAPVNPDSATFSWALLQ